MLTEPIELFELEELTFDRQNPRLPEFDLGAEATDEEIVRLLWERMDVREIAMSIAASGFFSHEPLIVALEETKNVVIEGNRRLAATKLLANPSLSRKLKISVPEIDDGARERLNQLPAMLASREAAWRYLGFKHVNGPAKWSSYAKSKYIARVHQEYGVELREIAKQIGDTHKTVQRLYRGLMVIEQAEREHVFDREDRWKKHFSFSHMYTGLDYDGLSSFLGLSSVDAEEREPVPAGRLDALGELCLWLYGSKKRKIEPLVRSQNPHLRQLDAVVRSKEARGLLRREGQLAHAFEVSRSTTRRFEEALIQTKVELQRARGLLTVGYDGSEELLRVAGSVANLADDLYEEMRRKHAPGSRARWAEDE